MLKPLNEVRGDAFLNFLIYYGFNFYFHSDNFKQGACTLKMIFPLALALQLSTHLYEDKQYLVSFLRVKARLKAALAAGPGGSGGVHSPPGASCLPGFPQNH